MVESIRSVLTVGIDRESHGRLEVLLRRSAFDVDRVSEVDSAIALVNAVAFDVVIMGFTLGQQGAAELIGEMRREGAPCRRSAALIVAGPDEHEQASSLIDGRFTRVLARDISDERLQREVSGLLRVSPRVGVRLAVRLELYLGEGPTMVMTQTENVSLGGLLARIRRPQPAEAKLRFELLLPDGLPVVRGLSEVVRHTQDWKGSVTGVGLRFVSFEEEGKALLSYFIASRISSDDR